MNEEKTLEMIENLSSRVLDLGLHIQAEMEIAAWATRVLEGGPLDSLAGDILEALAWGGMDGDAATNITEQLAMAMHGDKWRSRLAALETLHRIPMTKRPWCSREEDGSITRKGGTLMLWKNREMDLVYRDAEGNYLEYTQADEDSEVELWHDDADADMQRENIRAWFGFCPACRQRGEFFRDGEWGYATCQTHRLAWRYGRDLTSDRTMHTLEAEQESQVLRDAYTDVTEVVFPDGRTRGCCVVWHEEHMDDGNGKSESSRGRARWGSGEGYRHPHRSRIGPFSSFPGVGIFSMRRAFAASDSRKSVSK